MLVFGVIIKIKKMKPQKNNKKLNKNKKTVLNKHAVARQPIFLW